ncbi:hypothetical protein TWF569_009506 [Orbilia oligospora]|uniref:Uncharacterized protein n=1 Tax=Orbilia oligospora TaxID=2813651 RepID=A0A7C8J4P5_ORBOL|nr:hypothetical protein TWF706_000547 [Orbilia oligospora]KAF3088864.1 hypothetical protein TWF102_009820 [Orbilia oligospora]KAF3104517.1 hypothetical protein TWF103_006842 [Orbilia oligospora]KAF3126343.1 hypothetical protein TWF594_001152 [Orbilia oligospora]KAF3136197.1 hypothetical protein TWF569_009506 [Orbilia oligospora]
MSLPVYFELSWSILSTIGLVTFLIAWMVAGIVHLTTITMIPIVVSGACAIANGLCYYAFYASYPVKSRAVAAGFADIFWFIQEAGLSMYSYQILAKVLQRRQKTVFMLLFWTCIAVIFGCRLGILISRIEEIQHPENSLQRRINRLHMAYFVMIAVVETISAFFLLRTFTKAKRASVAIQSWTAKGLFELLSRSAEIRLATLCPIGITRAITYSFQATAQSATNTASQLDRFVYTLECLFPMVMIVDVLASKLTYSRATSTNSDRSRSRANGGTGPAPSSNANGIEVEFSIRTEFDSPKRSNSKAIRLASRNSNSEETIPVASHGAEVGHSASCHV